MKLYRKLLVLIPVVLAGVVLGVCGLWVITRPGPGQTLTDKDYWTPSEHNDRRAREHMESVNAFFRVGSIEILWDTSRTPGVTLAPGHANQVAREEYNKYIASHLTPINSEQVKRVNFMELPETAPMGEVSLVLLAVTDYNPISKKNAIIIRLSFTRSDGITNNAIPKYSINLDYPLDAQMLERPDSQVVDMAVQSIGRTIAQHIIKAYGAD